jgi:hypothetical protein
MSGWAYRVGLSMQCCYSFSIWWCGEAFHELGAQSAVVSALPGALPQSSVSPQLLIKVPGSQRSEGLWLCSVHHLGSSPPNISTVKKNCEALIFCIYEMNLFYQFARLTSLNK